MLVDGRVRFFFSRLAWSVWPPQRAREEERRGRAGWAGYREARGRRGGVEERDARRAGGRMDHCAAALHCGPLLAARPSLTGTSRLSATAAARSRPSAARCSSRHIHLHRSTPPHSARASTLCAPPAGALGRPPGKAENEGTSNEAARNGLLKIVAKCIALEFENRLHKQAEASLQASDCERRSMRFSENHSGRSVVGV